MTEILSRRLVPITVRLPYTRMDLLHLLRERARVVHEEYRPGYVLAEAEVDEETLSRVRDYVTSE